MKKNEVKIGGRYLANVSGKRTAIRILRESSHGGWDGVNETTNRVVRVRTARRLMREIGEVQS